MLPKDRYIAVRLEGSPVEDNELLHVVPELRRLAVWHLWEDARCGLVGLNDDMPAHILSPVSLCLESSALYCWLQLHQICRV